MFRILCDPYSGSVERACLKLHVIFLCAYAHKNITSNFSKARSILPEYGSQRFETCRSF